MRLFRKVGTHARLNARTHCARPVLVRTKGVYVDGHTPLAVRAVLHHAIGPTQRDVLGVSGSVTSKPGFSAARSAGTLRE